MIALMKKWLRTRRSQKRAQVIKKWVEIATIYNRIFDQIDRDGGLPPPSDPFR